MILTQTYVEIGSPVNLKPVGLVSIELSPGNDAGYGLPYKEAIKQLLDEAEKQYNIILNAKITITPDYHWHSAYGRKKYQLTGDQYKEV